MKVEKSEGRVKGIKGLDLEVVEKIGKFDIGKNGKEKFGKEK